MSTSKVWRITVTMMAAVLVIASFAGSVIAAPAAQELSAQEVKGTIPGGQSAEIWLGLETGIPGETIRIISTWDRSDPRGNGLGFYVLTDQHKTEVLNGTDPRLANLATGSTLSPESPDNEIGAEFQATSDRFTLIVYNDSPNDANFTITAENAVITDGSGQVEDANAESEMDEGMADQGSDAAATDEAEDTATTDEATAEATATEEAAAEEESATDEAVATATPAPAATEDMTDTEEMMADETMAVTATPGVVEGEMLEGFLGEKDSQHFLGLEPNEKDATISLVMSYNPQDNSELASRIGFWVLDQDAFNRFLNPDENVVLSQVAIAAGSGDQPGLAANERSASFTASGFGPYTVVVYNNSSVPADYELSVEGAKLIDDSGQTKTAMKSVTATGTVSGTVASEAVVVDEGESQTTPADATADTTPAREGEPGGTYVVQSGDTLSLISRDIYGEIGYWEDICSFNNLSDCNVLEVGDTIDLPTRDQLGTGATAPAATTTSTTTATTTSTATTTTSTSATAEADTTEEAATTAEDTAATTTESTTSTTTPVTSTTGMTSTSQVAATDEMTDTADSGAATETSGTDIMTTLEAQGGMSILVEALKAASLDDTLVKNDGPFTIFAPTDAAFEATLPNYEDLFANPAGTLTQLLLYHLISGSELTTSDIADGMQAATAHAGLPVKFEVTDDGLKVQDSVITAEDILASNGVIQVIDKVMIPSDLSQ